MKMTGVILTLGLSGIFGFMFVFLDVNNKIDFSYISKYHQISDLVFLFIMIIVLFSVISYVFKRIMR